MRRLIPAWTFGLTCALAVSLTAQDTTTKSKTEVKTDDGAVVTMTGCLSRHLSGNTFMLTGATMAAGEDLTTKTKIKTDVDPDDLQVKTKTRTTIDHAVGTSGLVTSYELTPKAGLDLTPHVGHKVTITAVALDPASGGDDDAKVTITDRTKVKTDDAPDAKVRTRTKAELPAPSRVEGPRGPHARLTVVSVQHVATSCTM